MKIGWSQRVAGACCVGVLIGASGQALAAGDTAGASEAESRLAEARAAYEAALAELRAAEAALTAVEADANTELGLRSDAEASADSGEGVAVLGSQPDQQPEAEPGFFSWDAWDKSIDLGLTGSSGNSENLNLRVQVAAERMTERMETKLKAVYRLTTQEGDQTENRFRFDARNEWLPPADGRLRWWIQGAYEYDEFQAWDYRISGAGGIGYEFIDNDKHTLVGRLGFGGSQTFGDQDEDFRPEAVAGVDYDWRIKEGQSFGAGTEVLLDVSETENLRMNSYVEYEILLDADSNMVFKIGASNRYDGEPGGNNKKNDLDYYATLGWKF